MVCLLHQWGSDIMTKGVVPHVPEAIAAAVQTAKTAQILMYIKENQLLTALCLFVLWQTGAFLSAASQVQGVMC